MLGLAGSTRSNSKCRVSSVGSLARASLGDRDLDLGQKVQIALLYNSIFIYAVNSGEKTSALSWQKFLVSSGLQDSREIVMKKNENVKRAEKSIKIVEFCDMVFKEHFLYIKCETSNNFFRYKYLGIVYFLQV